MDYCDWKRGIRSGIIAGIIWGWIAMAVNAVTKVFLFEHNILYNLIAFAAGGAIFGMVVGGLLILLHDRLPFKTSFSKAVLLSACTWLILRIGGALLSSIDSARHHAVAPATLQGLALAISMGCILGALWQVRKKRETC